MCVCVCVCSFERVCLYLCVCAFCVAVRALHVRVHEGRCGIYNLVLFQLRYIIFTCILQANVRQQLCVVRMHVGCIKRHKCYFLLYGGTFFCSVMCGVRSCYCDVCQNATV